MKISIISNAPFSVTSIGYKRDGEIEIRIESVNGSTSCAYLSCSKKGLIKQTIATKYTIVAKKIVLLQHELVKFYISSNLHENQ